VARKGEQSPALRGLHPIDHPLTLENAVPVASAGGTGAEEEEEESGEKGGSGRLGHRIRGEDNRPSPIPPRNPRCKQTHTKRRGACSLDSAHAFSKDEIHGTAHGTPAGRPRFRGGLHSR